MDPQLNSASESTKKDFYELMQECESYCMQEYARGQQDVVKQMLVFCNQQTGGDIRKMNPHVLLNYLMARRNQLLAEEEIVSEPIQFCNKKVPNQCQSEPSQLITINHERLKRFYQELNQ